MFISASGHVGIGNAAPEQRLHISATGIGSAVNETSWAQQWDVPSAPSNTNKILIGSIRTQTDSAPVEWLTSGMRIQAKVDSTWKGFIQFNGHNAQNGIQFGAGTDANTHPGNIPVAMTINANGYVGIGVENPVTHQLTLSQDSAYKPSTNVWDTTSDMRLKDNIEEANYETCYNIIDSIPLKRYTWKNEVFTAEQVPDRSKLGWIAQDVETVFPKAVATAPFYGPGSLTSGSFISGSILSGSYDGFYLEDAKTLNADQIYAAMYGTIKYLIAENNELKTQVSASNADIAAIKTHLGL
jgi:hypothetical protein